MALAAWIASDNADTIAINRSLWDALTIARPRMNTSIDRVTESWPGRRTNQPP